MTAQMYLPEFHVKQKLTLMVNRYEITTPQGQMMAVAEQKRMAFREQVTFFADAAKSQPVFSFKAKQVLDLGAGYDVSDAYGNLLGQFRKDFGASFLRSTFHLAGPGFEVTGQERSLAVALLRRFADLPLPVHFDFIDPVTGQISMSSDRKMSIGDRYTVTVPDQRLDFRLAAAMAVGLDALLAR